MKNPKLFIWTDFSPDYFGGLAFAIAKDEIQARKLVEKERDLGVYDWGQLEIRDVNISVARSVSGKS